MTLTDISSDTGRFLASVEPAIGVISGKWKCTILTHLMTGSLRFSELRKRIPKVTQSMLTSQLRDMEREGLLKRQVYAEVPVRVVYTITPTGKAAAPVLLALKRWGDIRKNGS